MWSLINDDSNESFSSLFLFCLCLELIRQELESWRDQRSPAEDMVLTDHKPMPVIPRIPHLKLTGKVSLHPSIRFARAGAGGSSGLAGNGGGGRDSLDPGPCQGL